MKVLKNVGLIIGSIISFLIIWNMASNALYKRAVSTTITKIEKLQSKEAAEETRKRIESGDPSSQPNSLPSPLLVWKTAGLLLDDAHKVMKKKQDFYKKMEKTNAKLKQAGKESITYTGRPSFLDQTITSLKNIFWGVLLAISIAIPVGILMGLSKRFKTSINWFVQIFKPISPVVWFLLVQMIVNTIMTDPDSDNAFVITFISVGLCAMWATLVNTSVGVSSVDESYLNVSKVLRLGIGKKIFKVVLPASIPLIFTGLRITVSVAWMVLIAVEWLSQSPGLGGFVREEFQNGSSSSNAKIMVAMFVIGIIGVILDKLMASVQGLVSFENKSQSPSPLSIMRNMFISKKAA